jgi:hypothetical protein
MKETNMHDAEAKAADALTYVLRLADGRIDGEVLAGTCYLADRLSIARFAHPMFGSTYGLGPLGPECPAVGVVARSAPPGLRDGEDLEELSQSNEECLKTAFEAFGGWTSERLAEWMSTPGNLPEWKKPDEAPILEDVMEGVGLKDVAEQALFVREMEDLARTMSMLARS